MARTQVIFEVIPPHVIARDKGKDSLPGRRVAKMLWREPSGIVCYLGVGGGWGVHVNWF